MIALQELLGSAKWENIDDPIQSNLQVLCLRLNEIRRLWAKPMQVTSGLRTMEDHVRIYKEKGITDVSKIPMKSHHLFGEAADILDPGLELTAWLKSTGSVLENAKLWCEEGNKNWVHFQIVPPKSGKRWFLP